MKTFDPRRIARSLAAGLLLGTSSSTAFASFQYPLNSARSAALGGASVYGAPEAGALFQSPASPAGLERAEAYALYQKVAAGGEGAGLGQGLLAAAVPTRLGVLGLGVADFHASGLLDERAAAVTLGGGLFGSVSGGVAVKYLRRDFLSGGDPLAAADPVFAGGTSKGAAAFDLGLRADPSREFSLGAVVRNANSPDLGLRSEDRVPREYQAGASWLLGGWGLRVSGDLSYRDSRVGTLRDRLTPGIGLEKTLEGQPVALRVGANTDQFSAGVGLELGRLGIDYSFVLSRELAADNAGTHLLGLRYRFGEGQ